MKRHLRGLVVCVPPICVRPSYLSLGIILSYGLSQNHPFFTLIYTRLGEKTIKKVIFNINKCFRKMKKFGLDTLHSISQGSLNTL